MKSILVMFHCQSDAGYAIDTLLPVFLRMAAQLVGEPAAVHVSFAELNRERPDPRLEGYGSVREYDPAGTDSARHQEMADFIRRQGIDVIFGFDQPVHRPAYRALRGAGVRTFVSYWGASMSSLSGALKLQLKRIEVALRRGGPDHYIFESQAMRDTAVLGRGVPARKTSLVRLGVDTERYRPDAADPGYAYQQFAIPAQRKILYYSGHMEPRKGVAVLMAAAQYLYHELQRRDFHLLVLGNQPGQEQHYLDMLAGDAALGHVTFGGYRHDVAQLLASSYLGTIASTGWDSFTMSSLEMAAAGLPLLVSDLQGLQETIEPGVTGYPFPPGDHAALAHHVVRLLDDPSLRQDLGRRARQRVLQDFSVERQVQALCDIVRRLEQGGGVHG